MFQVLVLFCLCWRRLLGVFGAETQSVMEGDSVTLNSDLTEICADDVSWSYRDTNSIKLAKINRQAKTSFISDVPDERFRDRLKLDDQTGSLTITNISTEHTGVYQLEIDGAKLISKTFSVSVYALLSVPVISRDCSSSSSSSQQNCSLVCSVVNVGHVTLSWYKGNSLLSSISVSDLSISLSLPLEVEYQDKNSYSCVLNNPISNQTQHLDITQLCHTCAAPDGASPSHTVSLIVLIAAGSLLIITLFGIFCIHRRNRKTDQEAVDDVAVAVQTHDEEIIYADVTFYKRNPQEMTATEDKHVEYSTVRIRL
ncbi:natural killer cell receptor 2B4 isoform X2 [Carassius gibelio]|uniref:natural killer cell receptor 2B4 isoform X2 n=1 Tax=Carassius gibelio TaxID=101364 RepID=UPI002277D2D3|nr:natural killer cell receptor 2B4 isoform X2 [Carassius gibelio]